MQCVSRFYNLTCGFVLFATAFRYCCGGNTKQQPANFVAYLTFFLNNNIGKILSFALMRCTTIDFNQAFSRKITHEVNANNYIATYSYFVIIDSYT